MTPVSETAVWLSIVYGFLGLTLTTMCVDAVGVRYLQEMHEVGRGFGRADYLRLLQQAKLRKRQREAMRGAFRHLSVVRHIRYPSPPPLPPPLSPEQVVKSPPKPPKPPRHLRVSDVAPYSMTLQWAPPDAEQSPSDDLRYLLKYRMK